MAQWRECWIRECPVLYFRPLYTSGWVVRAPAMLQAIIAGLLQSAAVRVIASKGCLKKSEDLRSRLWQIFCSFSESWRCLCDRNLACEPNIAQKVGCPTTCLGLSLRQSAFNLLATFILHAKLSPAAHGHSICSVSSGSPALLCSRTAMPRACRPRPKLPQAGLDC